MALLDERNFIARARELDRLEWLGAEAAEQRAQLEAVDAALFARLRADIRTGACRGEELLRVIRSFVPGTRGGETYDDLDVFVAGLLLDAPVPEATRALDAEMVAYQRTPSRIALELIAQLNENDVFYDIGSGLGEVVILANLLSGAKAKGIEREPAYVDYARACARDLNVDVQFEAIDAREADFSDGTVFFLYTPFRGRMLEEVLARLRGRVYAYGPITGSGRGLVRVR